MYHRGNWKELRDILLDAYINSIALITLNVLWFALMLPIVTALPALGGLYYATNRMAHDRAADWRTFFEGFKRYLWLSYRWGIMNLAALVLLSSSVYFYAQVQGNQMALLVRPLVLLLFVIWLLLQIYTFPLLLEQEDQRLITAIRNSAVIWIKRPLYSLGMTILLAGIVLISLVLGPTWIFITGSLCAYLANRAVVGSIAQIT